MPAGGVVNPGSQVRGSPRKPTNLTYIVNHLATLLQIKFTSYEQNMKKNGLVFYKQLYYSNGYGFVNA